jgi:hypothetical protein
MFGATVPVGGRVPTHFIVEAPMKQFVKLSGLVLTALVVAGLLYPVSAGQDKEKGKDKEKEKEKKQKVYEVKGDDGLKIEGKLADTDDRDKKQVNSYCKIYLVKLVKGKNYEIRMNAADTQQLDTWLRVEDAKGKQLAFNDDAEGENTLNSRIDFECKEDGTYRIIATSFNQDATGDYTVLVKEVK